MGANLTGLAKRIGELKSKAKKNYDVSFIPRGYSKLSQSEQLNLVNRLGKLINGENYSYKGIYSPSPKKPKTSKSKKSYGYKDFLKSSGLHDSSQSKQLYKDIKVFT